MEARPGGLRGAQPHASPRGRGGEGKVSRLAAAGSSARNRGVGQSHMDHQCYRAMGRPTLSAIQHPDRTSDGWRSARVPYRVAEICGCAGSGGVQPRRWTAGRSLSSPGTSRFLVGTTEVGDTGDPGKVQPSAEEIEYLLHSVQGLYPRARVSAGDVRCAFAGVRPLPYSPGADPSGLSRRHSSSRSFCGGRCGDDFGHRRKADNGGEPGARVRGQDRRREARLAWPLRRCKLLWQMEVMWTSWLERKIAEVAEAGSISGDSARGLVEWYGEQSLAIASAARNRPELREPLCPHTNHMVAEAVHAMTNEYAVTLGDVLLRRVPVALGACWSRECSREASQRVGAAMGWDEHQDSNQRGKDLKRNATAFLRKPAGPIRRSLIAGPRPLLHLQARSFDASARESFDQQLGIVRDDAVHPPIRQPLHSFLVIHRPGEHGSTGAVDGLHQSEVIRGYLGMTYSTGNSRQRSRLFFRSQMKPRLTSALRSLSSSRTSGRKEDTT